MRSKKALILPQFQKKMEIVGENIKLARKRRKLTTIQVAERAAIDRSTLYQIEKGNASVAIGSYYNVLRALGLQEDINRIASDDPLGRTLQDLELLRSTKPKKKKQGE